MNILVSGATGLIGQQLCTRLQREGHTVSVFSRSMEKGRRLGFDTIVWQPEKELPAREAIDAADVIVHLAGEHIAAGRWTSEHKQRIRNSRVLSTRNLVAGMRASSKPPRALVCASAIGFYGDRANEDLTEFSPPGSGFLAEVCQEWEAEAAAAREFIPRVASVRIGVVLAPPNAGGALQQIIPVFKFGLGGNLGNGRQWFPWIHVDDVVGILHHSIFNDQIYGPINAVAPRVVTNAEFTETVATVLHRPAIFSAPSFMLRLVLGEMADLLLSSVRVLPERALTSGYVFQFPGLKSALENLLSPARRDTNV